MERISSATPVLFSLLFSDILMHIAEHNEYKVTIKCSKSFSKVLPKLSPSFLNVVLKLSLSYVKELPKFSQSSPEIV